MLFLYLLALAITILIEYIVANAFYDIACEKGFENRKYFWYSFLSICSTAQEKSEPDAGWQ